MPSKNSNSKFQRELALANDVMLNHFPVPPIEDVFAGARNTLSETLEIIFEKVGEVESEELKSALARLTILYAVIEHHMVMVRIQRHL